MNGIEIPIIVSGIQVLLLPFQVIHFYSRKIDRTRLRFLIFTLLFLTFNSFWILHFYSGAAYFFTSRNILFLSGVVLIVYTFNYLKLELSIPQERNEKLIFFIVIVLLGIIWCLVDLFYSFEWLRILFAVLFSVVFLIKSIDIFRYISRSNSQGSNPILYGAYGSMIISCLIPIILAVTKNHSIGFLIINLAFVIIAVAYFRHYFAQISIENNLFKATTYFSNLNLSERYQSTLDVLNSYDLTSREREIGLLLLEGKTYRQISEISNVAETTIRTHASKIYQKTGITGRRKLEQFKNKFSGGISFDSD